MSVGFTVALIGPDGAGKTTVARELEETLPFPVKYVYMGVNPDSSNYLLPTTKALHSIRRRRGSKPDTAGPKDSRQPDPRPPSRRGRLRSARSFVRLANRLAEEWHRAAVASFYRRRGTVVVFDRHFFADYYAYDVAASPRRTASRRLHGYILERIYPRPDLVIYLDAPAEVLLGRKGEGTLESLGRRRQEYLELGRVLKGFAVVDANRPLDAVIGDVTRTIERFAGDRSIARPDEARS